MEQTPSHLLDMSQIVQDVNTLSTFLASAQVTSWAALSPVDVIVLCVSAILQPAVNLFRALEDNPSLARTLVLCGGKGHSTPFLYTSISTHPQFSPLLPSITGLPEAQVLSKLISSQHFSLPKMTNQGLSILVEDQSTNCSANAVESKKLLDKSHHGSVKRILLIQDPTMSLRTKASFQKVFSVSSDASVEIVTFPGFVPKVKAKGAAVEGGVVMENLEFDIDGSIKEGGLWEMSRFLDLIMGEIPRFERYGPRGMGSIVDVEIPRDVREAWQRLDLIIGEGRGR